MRKELKIAVFYNLPTGGALKALQDSLRFLKSNGHYIDVYTLDTADDSFAPLKDFIDNYYVYPVRRSKFRKILFGSINKIIPSVNLPETSNVYIRFNDFKNAQKKIANDINVKDYDLVFLGQDATFTVSPAILEYLEKSTLYYCQEPSRTNEKILRKLKDESNTFFNKIYIKYFKQKYIKLDIEYASYADSILVNSYYSHENLLKVYGLNSQVSYLGIDINHFKCHNLPRENFILSVGMIVENKGFDFIIKSVGKVDKKFRPKLIITGYSVYPKWKNYLIQLAKDEGVELELLEGISYDELVELYNRAKLFVFGSYLEPFGLVPLEALACGTPVVSVKEGGMRETVVHNQNGFLVDRDERKFGEAIEKLLTNDELWDKFSKDGPKYIEDNWTLDHAGQNLLYHIYRILEKNEN